jgi:hypothetical protein
LAGLKNVPRDSRSAEIYVLETRRKTQDAEKIIKSTIDEPERAKLLSTVRRAGEFLVDRNLVIHACISYKTKTLADPIYVPFRGKHVGKEIPVSKETVESIFNDADNLCRELSEICSTRGYTVFLPAT